MKRTKKLITKLLLALTLILSSSSIVGGIEKPPEHDLRIWYDKPANTEIPDNNNAWKDDPEWLKALPLGNGSLGAMVYGDVNRERIQLNEESMWSGSSNDDNNPNAYPALDDIRNLLFKGKYKESTVLTNQTQVCKGKGSGQGNGANVPFGCYQTLGDLWFNFGYDENYSNYSKELDLNDAVVRINYTIKGVNYKREIFTSQPHQVMVAKFSADKSGQISFSCKINRPERFNTYTKNNQLIMTGTLDDGNGGDGLHYLSRLTAINTKGRVSFTDSSIIVEEADEVILILSASTDYLLKYPEYKGRDFETITDNNLKNASVIPYEKLLEAHKIEYQKYFKRVNFDITPDKISAIPTDERIRLFRGGNADPHLVELVFQYGRYLLISSSRPGSLPANLQGVWANKIQTPWNSDYHTDVNVEMNYWPAEVTNLSEIHLPLFDLIESLVGPGTKTARVHYKAKGWVVHPITNVWGYTAPGERASWGMHTGAGAWISSHIMEHYRFSGDKKFLKRMYPILKGSVEFYLDWLVEDPRTGKLVSGPAVSPENTFIAPDESRSQISMGPAHDQQVIWTLFNDFTIASEILGKEDEFLVKVKSAKENLSGDQIGSDGRLMEWAEEFPEVEPGHRHISHLFALHPGYQISQNQTPKLAEAAKKSLDYRIEHGGGHTGWSAAWLISQYARLGEAEKAKNSLDVVLRKNISPNLFTQHPPFQMDANFGVTAGIAEMLIQSHAGEIHLLPGLPQAWGDGSVEGLCARGGFVVDMDWEKGVLIEMRLISKLGKRCKIRYGKNSIELETKRNHSFRFDRKLNQI